MSDLLAFSKIPNEINSSLADCGLISVPYKKAGIDISLYTLKNIWASAAELVQNSHKIIMPAPCLSEHISKYSVLKSMRSNQDSQLVTFNSDLGMFSCDCKYYAVHSICSHTVACAEINDKFGSFLKWHKDKKLKTNRYKQTTYNVNMRSVGQKGNIPRRNRKKQKNLPTTTSSLSEATIYSLVPK